MKKTIIRIMSMLLTIVLAAGALPVSAWAREGLSRTVQEQAMELSRIVTSGAAVSPHSGSGLPLAEGSYERWIDRLADVPDYAMDLYRWMEENSDADGSEDALIQVETAKYLSGNYVYEVAICAESVPFTVAEDADDDTIMAAGAQAANAIINENMTRVGAWVSAVVQSFDRDHGEVFWLSGSNRIFMPSCQIRFEFNGTDWKAVFEQKICMVLKARNFDIRAEEYRDEAFLRGTIRERDRAVNRILATVTGTTRLEQIRQINSWLTKNNCYNTGANLDDLGADARNCVGALDGRTGEQGPVCEGYARAFQVLCKALDIPCVLVDGEASNGSRTEGHMWNYVQMENGKWYAVDVTWNDPGVAGVTGAVSGLERENFLLCGSDTVVGGITFLQSHPVSNTVADGGTAFINGPVLERDAYAYDPTVHVHIYTEMITPPTCTEQGSTTYTCTCGESYVGSYVEAAGHSFGDWEIETEATCTSKGEERRECENCGHVESRETDVTKHVYESVVTAPTCTERGYTTHTCVCGESYVDAYVPENGHDFDSWQEADDLVHQRSCAACGHRETELHTWGEETVGENGITKTQSCTICRYTKRELSPIVGAWETDIVFPAADMGVQAPDIVFRCKLTFADNGTVRADWEAVELTAIRMYFHTMFVNAYYACAYGAGINSFEEAEQHCLESTGKGVSEYMDDFLDGFDMYALFKPESTEGSYRINTDENAMYTDLQIMAMESDPEIANCLSVSADTLEWTADSYEKPEYTFHCTSVSE